MKNKEKQLRIKRQQLTTEFRKKIYQIDEQLLTLQGCWNDKNQSQAAGLLHEAFQFIESNCPKKEVADFIADSMAEYFTE